MARRIFIGTKVWPERDIVTDVCYVQFEESGELWLMNLERKCSNLVVNKTIEELKEYFDEWRDLGTVPDGVRISNVLRVTRHISLR